MTKANLVLPNGTKVNIEGSPHDISSILALFSPSATSSEKPGRKKRAAGKRPSPRNPTPKGPTGLITELAKDGFFKTKRTLPDIQKKLEEGGHIYAQTSLSNPVRRLTTTKVLRRMKENKKWFYVRGAAEI